LGIGAITDIKKIPVNLSRIFLHHRFYCSSNSNNHGIGYNLDGKLYSWGKTKNWRIGQNTKESCILKPTQVRRELFYKAYANQENS
jgi:hypothetical protein